MFLTGGPGMPCSPEAPTSPLGPYGAGKSSQIGRQIERQTYRQPKIPSSSQQKQTGRPPRNYTVPCDGRMGKWKHSKENGLAQGHIDLESRPLASQLKALSPEPHRGRGREKDGGEAPVGPSPRTPSQGPQPSHSPASPGGRNLPEARACQDAPAGKERAQSRSPPHPPSPKTWARSSPSLPAAPGALSRPLDSRLDTGKEIPQGSEVTGLPQANWAVLPHLASSEPSSHRTWLHLSAAAPPLSL